MGWLLILILGCWSCDPASAPITVHFEVAAQDLDDDEAVFIAGNQPIFKNWRPDGLKLMPKDGRWVGIIHLDTIKQLEFKLTKGSWETEALLENGEVPDNYRIRVSRDTTIRLSVPQWKSGESQHKLKGQITGTLKYHKQFKTPGLPDRDVSVWLPPGYTNQPENRYPVIYAHDGQNLFDPATASFGVDWGMDEVADSLIRHQIIEPVIIVGIASTEKRSYEYGPFLEGEQYMRFVTQTLKPFIDKNYRTLPSQEYTTTWGASMGGLIAFMLVWEHNATFSKAACFSPAFQFSFQEERIDYPAIVEEYRGQPKKMALYIDNGTLGVDDMLQLGVDAMTNTLEKQNYPFNYYFADGADHNEAAWSARVWRPMTQFFGK